MVNIYLLNYNSYYTRQIKKLSTISEYSKYIVKSFTNINFIFNDGVNTTQILNYNPAGNIINYCIVEDLDNNSELSRWFIINSIRTRKGQYQISLHRDLIADNLKLSVLSTSYILKAYAKYGEPAFYSDEQIDTSQLLKKREYLTDKSGCSWLVAYVKPHNYSYTGTSGDTDDPNKWENTTVNGLANTIIPDYTYSTYKAAIEAINPYNEKYLSPKTIRVGSQYWSHIWTTGGYYYFEGEYSNKAFKTNNTYYSKMGNNIFSYHNDNSVRDADIYNHISNYLEQYMSTAILKCDKSTDCPSAFYTECPYPAGSIFKCGDNFYKLVIRETSTDLSLNDYNNMLYFVSGTNLDLSIKNLLGSTIDNDDLAPLRGVVPVAIVKADSIERRAYLELINNKTAQIYNSFTISKNRNSCGAYDIIATPYKTPDGIGITIDGHYCDPHDTLPLFQAMTSTWSDDVVYDIQILPYCPISKIAGKDISSVSKLTGGIDYSTYVNSNNKLCGYIFYGSSADINFDISYNIPTITNKTDYICKKYKLVAPNFGSSYDIPVAQNFGVDTFNISMTPLPYSPWIKISPVFKGLNGANYNDSRGLIINGSLQITQITDAFAEYQYSNSNYQSIFDRQIENSQKLYDIQHTQNILSGSANVVSAGISGAAAGGLVGGPLGAVGGAVLGIGASAIGLTSDLNAQAKTQAENIDYTKDQFALSMGNIKSQGTSISKITAINEANTLIPFIEYYDSTDDDREAVSNKLKYNGMTINRIGTIMDYLSDDDDLHYYQTKLIKPYSGSNAEYNYDYLNALGLELSQGFFADHDTIFEEV